MHLEIALCPTLQLLQKIRSKLFISFSCLPKTDIMWFNENDINTHDISATRSVFDLTYTEHLIKA